MAKYVYALIDGVMRQTAIKDLYAKGEPLQMLPLYINTPYQENYDLGPILVAALEDSHLIQDLQNNWAKSTTLLHSNETLSTVAEHLTQFITITNDAGSNALLRFADPLVTWYWLNSYETNALPDILGPIQHWQVAKPIPDWQPQTIEWRTTSKPQDMPLLNIAINHLHQPQLDALDEAAAFRFKNQVYQWLAQESPSFIEPQTTEQLGTWLDTCYQQAIAFNLITERSIATWINLCADYGQDFAIDKKGAYQQWLQQNAEQKPLPAELKLQNFYTYLAEPS